MVEVTLLKGKHDRYSPGGNIGDDLHFQEMRNIGDDPHFQKMRNINFQEMRNELLEKSSQRSGLCSGICSSSRSHEIVI
jgi:hypothetical protein